MALVNDGSGDDGTGQMTVVARYYPAGNVTGRDPY